MKTLTRREAAKKLKIKDTNLIYWERLGRLQPKKIKVGNSSLVVYTPELVEKARKILSRDNRREREEMNEENYLIKADKFLATAQKEFKEGKTRRDQIKIRDAAEKAWNATVHATNGLFAKKKQRIPKNNRQRREGLERIAPELRGKFEAKAHSLHSQCFYDGICPLDIIEEDIEKVAEYIQEVKKL